MKEMKKDHRVFRANMKGITFSTLRQDFDVQI